ncbi:acyl carrier protein [Oceanospirillum beijerinckii]|uniref:acyl carrier protein n=1 Tax=Oceanospirillum beijerinckii TaxID=64976 RepID=UPI000426FFCE|nr:acyl carrier protein [Oceanospirillum beijerinckii]
MRDKIIAIIADVLEVEASDLSEQSSPSSIESWDSLKHMNIILALEEEFDVELDDEEITDMNSIALIILILSEKLG